MSASGVLIAGTSSDAGKSLMVAGLCAVAARRGRRVAPFKAQNMSNNSMVCADGGEIGRAQHIQAIAAGVGPSTLMNPVLLKPGSDRRSFVVVRGRPAGVLEAGDYATGRLGLREAAFAAYAELASQTDLIICEGAGSPAEINLRTNDYVNFGLATEFDLPVHVVGDIDRGGLLAAFYGTWAVVDAADRALLAGFIVNKFRGDVEVLRPGLTEISRRTGVPVLGVVPWLPQVWLDGEDSLAVARWSAGTGLIGSPAASAYGGRAPARPLTVAVARLPRISNATDLDPLAVEPGVEVVVTADPALCLAADLLIVPGSRSTVDDLAWMRAVGLDVVVARRVADERPILGICGGYQMLARTIHDDVEAQVGVVRGLGALDAEVTFAPEKTTGRVRGRWRGEECDGYVIHHGRVAAASGEDFPGGASCGPVWGSMWHGLFEADGFRRAFLTEIADRAGVPWSPRSGDIGFRARRARMLDTLADAVEDHLDVDAVLGGRAR